MVMGDNAWAAKIRSKETELEDSTEHCIHCEAIWPESHMRNGACPACTKKGLAGRNVVGQRQWYGRSFLVLIGIAIVTLVIFSR